MVVCGVRGADGGTRVDGAAQGAAYRRERGADEIDDSLSKGLI